MGGYNARLVDEQNRSLPLISDVPSIIIGADVSHPRVGDDSSPSISAVRVYCQVFMHMCVLFTPPCLFIVSVLEQVAASMDWPYFSQYEAIVQTQRHREEVCEEFFWEREDLQGMKQTGGIIK